MAKRYLVTLLVVVAVGLAWAFVLSPGFCGQDSGVMGNFESSYTFTVQNGYYLVDHTLYVSFPPSVKEYYSGKSHIVYNPMDYAKFVTPSAVQSAAKNIRNITQETPYDEEEFANAVLMIVRQIPYVKSNAKYPVETFVSNQADCDGLSILAASIMKAGGLDVVLLLYDGVNPPHMNIGVSLEQMPVSHSWWAVPAGFEYGNKTYWVAECTSFADWNVGDRPRLLESSKPQIIPLTNCEKDSPAQIYSSLDSPSRSSSISIRLTAGYSQVSNDTRFVNVSGSIFPALPNQTITLYVNQPGYAPKASKVVTDEFGSYTECWNVTLPGTYIMKTSWSGSIDHSGSDSDAITVFIGAQKPVIEGLVNDISSAQISYSSLQQNSPWYMALLNQGSKEFLKRNLTGREVVLSGDFMVLSDGCEIQLNDTTFTIPAHPRTYRLPRSTRTATIMVPEEIITIPGVELLNSHFGFILTQNDPDNYTASLRVLNSNDLSQINQSLNESRAVFINASDVAAKETWYTAVAKVSADSVSVEVCDENGTRLSGMSQSNRSRDLSELGVLVTYQTGQIIAFKNLHVEETIRNITPITDNIPLVTPEVAQGNGFEFLYPFVRIGLLSAGTVLSIVCLLQRRKRHQSGQDLFENPSSVTKA